MSTPYFGQILSVGFDFPGGVTEGCSIIDKQSAMDFEVIVFAPSVPFTEYETSTYQGRPSLNDDRSYRAKSSMSHWCEELRAAAEAGALIVVYVAAPQEVFTGTGRVDFSGTGRNARSTRIVEETSSYASIPLDLRLSASGGTQMKLAAQAKPLTSYWREFEDASAYEAHFTGSKVEPLLTTKMGGRVVGGYVRQGRGALILLPPLLIDEDDLHEQVGEGDDAEWEWTTEGTDLGVRLASQLLQLHQNLCRDEPEELAPDWSHAPAYSLPKEETLRRHILEVRSEIDERRAIEQALTMELENAGQLRALLYGQGPQLETVVREALTMLGYEVTTYAENDSEFDVVFEADGIRLIGEIEGRNNKPIGIDKFSQLERNLNEDFARDEIADFALGALFGNAFRTMPPPDRGDCFTDKCIKAAARLGAVLIRTPDLFEPCRYLSSNTDSTYAQDCRNAISQSKGGIVRFPPPPETSINR